ncbi:MAG: hypothetical protein GY730_06125 [bacterium]|nr:hypothetical protein [bacterium]
MGKERYLHEKLKKAVYAKDRKAFLYHIPDGFRTSFKPFDNILDTGRYIFFIELKQLDKNRKSFKPTSIFLPHQIRILNQIYELHKRDSTINTAIPMVGRGKDVFILHPLDLLKERISLSMYKTYSIEDAVDKLWQGV